MRILLLGGNGYIGSKFYKKYRDEFDITSIDMNLFPIDLGWSERKNFNDLSEEEIKKYDVVILLAGHSSVQMCEYSPTNSWTNNVEYFRNLCDKLDTSQLLIYASSASVYGSGASMSSEDSPINFNPINHYDLQKTTIDLIANKYISQGHRIIGLRFGTVNGSAPNTRSELMLNSMVKSALDTGVVNAKNLHIRRAILGNNDLIRALEKIITTSIPSGQYNLASFNSTVGDLANEVSLLCGAKLIVHPDDPISYDFEMTTEKFESFAIFEFTDHIHNLVDDLITGHGKANYFPRFQDDKFGV